jgi:hypothetical protein
MGVNIYLLDRRPVQLVVAGTLQHIGALRGFWKVTEMDDERVRELRAAETAASLMPSPKAAMIADVEEKPLAREADTSVRAHCVIGWDEGRTSVTDMRWDFLPVLGYAVRNPDGAFVLHEERDDGLHGLERERALQLGLIDREGRLVRRGQPVILECRSVVPFITGYAEADCSFDDGGEERLLIRIPEGPLPEPAWLAGKTPERWSNTRRRNGWPPGRRLGRILRLPEPFRQQVAAGKGDTECRACCESRDSFDVLSRGLGRPVHDLRKILGERQHSGSRTPSRHAAEFVLEFGNAVCFAVLRLLKDPERVLVTQH